MAISDVAALPGVTILLIYAGRKLKHLRQAVLLALVVAPATVAQNGPELRPDGANVMPTCSFTQSEKTDRPKWTITLFVPKNTLGPQRSLLWVLAEVRCKHEQGRHLRIFLAGGYSCVKPVLIDFFRALSICCCP